MIGGGPAGLSVAWQLWMKGHDPVVYEKEGKAGRQDDRHDSPQPIPDEVLNHELQRIREVIEFVSLEQPLTVERFMQIRDSSDFVVIAVGVRNRPS